MIQRFRKTQYARGNYFILLIVRQIPHVKTTEGRYQNLSDNYLLASVMFQSPSI